MNRDNFKSQVARMTARQSGDRRGGALGLSSTGAYVTPSHPSRAPKPAVDHLQDQMRLSTMARLILAGTSAI